MSHFTKIFCLLLLASLTQPLAGQELVFDHLNEKNGLSQNYVNCLLQDREGFLWIGTQDGLNRYDGKEFRVFRHFAADTASLSSSYIHCLFEDEKGQLWVGTQFGLNRFDAETETFQQHIREQADWPEAENNILCGTADGRGFIWYGAYHGLFRLQPETGETLHFLPDSSDASSISHHVIWRVDTDDQGRLWIGTNGGLNILTDAENFHFEKFQPNPSDPHAISSNKIWGFAQNENYTIWLAANNGVNLAIPEGQSWKFRHFQHEPDNPNSLSHNFIQTLLAEGNNRLWVGTYDGGLNELIFPEGDKNSPIFRRYLHDERKPFSLRHNEVRALLRDRSGILWVGTAAGLDKVDEHSHKFQLVQQRPDDPRSLSGDHVQAILRDSRGDLWIGTRGGGLNRLSKANFEKKNFQFEVFRHDPGNPASLSHDDVFGLYEDRHGYLWISTYDGLNFIHLPTFGANPVFRSFNVEDGLSYKFIYQVFERENGEHWVASYGRLNRMFFDSGHPERTMFQQYDMDTERGDALVNASTFSLAGDRFGQLWVSTFSGISKLISSEGKGIFENYTKKHGDPASLSDNYAAQLFLDKKGRLWAATNGGLNYLRQTSASEPVTFRSFGVETGLPAGIVNGIAEDGEGKLWLSTSGGLVHFDPEIALGETGESPVLKVYDYRDGLQGNEFVERSVFQDTGGVLFFGGINGFNFFKPTELAGNQYVPGVAFTEFRLFNKTVRPGPGKHNPLEKAINHTRQITLRHWQNVFSFRFAALSFSQPEKNSYAFKMEGFDEDWNFSGNVSLATYTNLSPGSYTFKVKAANNDGIWNESPAEIAICILPPPWLTWWAYLLYGLILGGLLYGVYKFRVRQKIRAVKEEARIEKVRFEERELLRKQNAADFHDELGHRLTKISLFLELAERQGTPGALGKYLSKVKQHTAGLSTGIRDLIWTLDPEQDSLLQTLIRLREFGGKLFEEPAITFQARGVAERLEEVRLESDVRKHLLLIFKEAMNNCLKYSEATQAILEVKNVGGGIQISFQDNGKGFDTAARSPGYGLRNMQERARKIGAKFELKTQPGEGVTVTVAVGSGSRQ